MVICYRARDRFPGALGELSAGQSATCMGVYSITTDNIADGQVDNTAIVTGLNPDGNSVTDTNDITISLTEPQNTTMAIADTATTLTDNPVQGNVLSNDTDPEGDQQSVQSVQVDNDGDGVVNNAYVVGETTVIYGTNADGVTAQAGTIALSADGMFTFTPDSLFVGDVLVDISIVDVNVAPATDSSRLTIAVTDVAQVGPIDPVPPIVPVDPSDIIDPADPDPSPQSPDSNPSVGTPNDGQDPTSPGELSATGAAVSVTLMAGLGILAALIVTTRTKARHAYQSNRPTYFCYYSADRPYLP